MVFFHCFLSRMITSRFSNCAVIHYQVLRYLDGQFQGRELFLGSRRGSEWAPRSPDLNPLDYFLWGYLKSKVYTPRPATMRELINKITTEVTNLRPAMVRRAVQDLLPRSRLVVNNGGGYVEQSHNYSIVDIIYT